MFIMKWQIELHDIEVQMRVGIHPHERTPQRILVSVLLDVDYARTPETITECVDYDGIYQMVMEWSQQEHEDLLETLCAKLAQTILDRYARVTHIRCKVGKPDVFQHAKRVDVCLSVERISSI